MNIRNYTSEVAVERSITLIEHRLVAAGATHISKSYEGQNLVGILFQMVVDGQPLTFRVPAKTEACFSRLWKEVRKPRSGTEKLIREQAGRTAWKLVADWVDVQTSMVLLEQAEAVEVFMPYLYDGKRDRTLFQAMKADGFKQLTDGGRRSE